MSSAASRRTCRVTAGPRRPVHPRRRRRGRSPTEIEREAGGRAIVVGLSLGGYVAMEVAARWPERVAGLVLAGATAEPVGPRSLAYIGLAAHLRDGRSGLARSRSTSGSSGRGIRRPIAEPILAGRLPLRAAGRSPCGRSSGERFRPRLARYPGRTAHHQRRVRPAVPAVTALVCRRGAGGAGSGPPSRGAPLEPRSAGRVHGGCSPLRARSCRAPTA